VTIADIDETMPAQNLLGSEIGGASESAPQTPEEIFEENLGLFRAYAFLQGAYFDEHGWLVYKGKVLTRSESEYLDQSETPHQRLLDEEEIQAAWENLVDYVYEYEGEGNE